MMRPWSAVMLLSLLATFPARALSAPSADRLVVIEDLRCRYCSFWEHEVGRIYAKTDEAKVLPLRRVDYGKPLPADLPRLQPIETTPTFIIVHCGAEFRRITGYRDADAFWGLLDAAIRDLADPQQAPPCIRTTP